MIRLVLFLMMIYPSSKAYSQDSTLQLYTPHLVKDFHNKNAKGAVQLVWEKGRGSDSFEVQISNGDNIYKVNTTDNYKHVMLYFHKNYQWRVVDLNQDSRVSNWRPLNVEKGIVEKRVQKSQVTEIESLAMDYGSD